MPRLSVTSRIVFAVAQEVALEVKENGPLEPHEGEDIGDLYMRVGEYLGGKLKRHARATLRKSRQGVERFERRLNNNWAPAIDTLEIMYLLAIEIGSTLLQQAQSGATKQDRSENIFVALTGLMGRGCKTVSEILSLVKSGHAEAADARWRTLHELSITAMFIRQEGEAVAVRYLDHGYIENKRGILPHQRYAAKLGITPFEEAVVAGELARADEVIAKYGPSFGSEFGWAAEVLKKKRPTFADLERHVSLDHWRLSYKRASHSVHASSYALHFALSMPTSEEILVGPSNAGLAGPIQGAAIALAQLMSTMLLDRGEDGSRAPFIAAFFSLCHEVQHGAVRAQSRLDDRAILMEKKGGPLPR